MKVRWKLACLLFAITILVVSIKYSQSEMSLKYENDVYVSNEDEDDGVENMHQINKRDTNSNQDILKTYIKNLKNVRLFFFMIYRLRIDLILKLKKKDQELVLSSGAGFSNGNRYKSGDIHIRKGSRYEEKKVSS